MSEAWSSHAPCMKMRSDDRPIIGRRPIILASVLGIVAAIVSLSRGEAQPWLALLALLGNLSALGFYANFLFKR